MEDLGTIIKSTDENGRARREEEVAQKLREQRLNWEKRWLIEDRFMDGKHFETWNKVTAEFSSKKFPKGMRVRPIHYATKITEGLLNNLLAADPRWQIYPVGIAGIKDDDLKKKKIEYAHKLEGYFESIWDTSNITNKVIDGVWYGLKYCFGVWEIYWDIDNNRPAVRAIKPYNILFDPTVKDIQDSPIVIKEIVEPLDKVKSIARYNDNKNLLKPTGEVSGSQFEATSYSEKYRNSGSSTNNVIVREVWINNYLEGGWDVDHISQGKPLFHEHYDFTRNPFVSWSYEPEPLLQTSFYEKQIPLNRAVDITLAQIETWTRTVAVGRMLKKAGVDIKRISGAMGEIIEADAPLDTIQWLQVPDIGVTPFSYLDRIKSLATEMGAVTASIGQVPSKNTGYKMVESLKASEMSSVQHSIRRLEGTLEQMAEVTLMYIHSFATTPIEVETQGVNSDSYEIVSEMQKNNFVDAVPVSDRDYNVNVDIESGLAYTPDAKKQIALEMAGKGLIPLKVALDYLHIGGNTEEIATQALNEMALKAAANKGEAVSMIDTKDFKSLPSQLQQQILQYEVSQGQNEQNNNTGQ